jgi:transposase
MILLPLLLKTVFTERLLRTAAVLRSFVSSCELVRVDPFAWFRDVLSRIAEHPITRLGDLLPHRWAQASR